MIHTNMPRNYTVFLLPRRLTRSAIYESQIFDPHKWPTGLVRKVKGKPRNFEACLCGSLYSTFKTSFQPNAFYKKTVTNAFHRPPRPIQANNKILLNRNCHKSWNNSIAINTSSKTKLSMWKIND